LAFFVPLSYSGDAMEDIDRLEGISITTLSTDNDGNDKTIPTVVVNNQMTCSWLGNHIRNIQSC
jgi:hypothetical protein